MSLQSVKLKSLSFAVLLPLVGIAPFIVLLRRDFAAFQNVDFHAAATAQEVPWTRERAVAAVVAMVCMAAGFFQIGYRSFSTSGPLASVRSWQRLILVVGYSVFFLLLIYFTSPKGYFVW